MNKWLWGRGQIGDGDGMGEGSNMRKGVTVSGVPGMRVFLGSKKTRFRGGGDE